MDLTNLIPIITAVIGLLGSYITAKLTTKREFKKIIAQQKHEIKLNKYKAFADMNSAVNAYTLTPIPKFQRDALSAIGSFIPYASEQLLSICEILQKAVENNQHNHASELIFRIRSEYLSEQKAKQDQKSRF